MGFLQGFEIAFELQNLIYCFVGVFVGTLVGVLPGIGPSAAMALLLPLTYKMSALGAIIMLAGIYYGAMYGGSTTSILVNIPGEAASVMTTCTSRPRRWSSRVNSAALYAAIPPVTPSTTDFPDFSAM